MRRIVSLLAGGTLVCGIVAAMLDKKVNDEFVYGDQVRMVADPKTRYVVTNKDRAVNGLILYGITPVGGGEETFSTQGSIVAVGN